MDQEMNTIKSTLNDKEPEMVSDIGLDPEALERVAGGGLSPIISGPGTLPAPSAQAFSLPFPDLIRICLYPKRFSDILSARGGASR